MFALKDLLDAARLARTSTAGRTAPSSIRKLGRAQLSVQRHHRGHRAGRRHPAGRHQSAARSGRAQRAHPQALAPGQRWPSALIGERADLDLSLRVSGRRPADAEGGARRQAQLRRRAARRQAADGDRRRRRRGARATARPCWRSRRRSRCWPATARTPAGTSFNVLHTAASRVAGLDLGFVPGEAGSTSPASTCGRRGSSTSSICSAPTRST